MEPEEIKMKDRICPFKQGQIIRNCTNVCEWAVVDKDLEPKCVLKVMAFELLDILHELKKN